MRWGRQLQQEPEGFSQGYQLRSVAGAGATRRNRKQVLLAVRVLYEDASASVGDATLHRAVGPDQGDSEPSSERAAAGAPAQAWRRPPR